MKNKDRTRFAIWCSALGVFAVALLLGWAVSRRDAEKTSRAGDVTSNLVSGARGTRIARCGGIGGGRGATALPGGGRTARPQRGPAGEVIDSRVTLLPPDKTGARRFRRERLISPVGGGAPLCVEETCSGDESNPKVESCVEFVADRLLVTVDGKMDFEQFCRDMAAKGFTVEKPLMTLKSKGNAKITVVRGNEAVLGMIAKIKKGVAACDPAAKTCRNVMMYADESDPAAVRCPNDTCYGRLWGMERIGAPYAWAAQTEATNVIVAVIDTGCNYNHVDLKDNIWVNPNEIPGNGIDDDGNGIVDDVHGAAFLDNVRKLGDPYDGWRPTYVKPSTSAYNVLDDSPTAGWGHGTHCAGIIGAAGDNSEGVAGVAWNVRIMPVQFMRPSLRDVWGGVIYAWKSSGNLGDALKAFAYARDNGATICSCSFTGGYSAEMDRLYNDIIEEFGASGVIVVCAAGNAGTDNDVTPQLPSSCRADNIVAVASSDPTDGFSSFSNWGATSVDIAAPGGDNSEGAGDIYSTCVSDVPGEENCSYAYKAGTSMATPMVAGCLALIKAAYPGETYGETIRRLYDAGVTIPSMVGKMTTGKRVSLERAIVGDVWQPVAPDVTVSQGEYRDRVVVSWHSTGGALARVWRASSEKGAMQLISGWVAGTNYTDDTMAIGKTHWYAVQVAKAASEDRVSPLSARVSGFADNPDLDVWDLAGDGTMAGATVLTPGNRLFGGQPIRQSGHRLSSLDTSDWYCLDAEYGATYTLRSEGATARIFGDIYGSDDLENPIAKHRALYGENNLYWRGHGTSYTLRVNDRAKAGRYYLRVYPESAAKPVSYTIVCSRMGGYDAWDREGADDVPDGASELAHPSTAHHVVSGISLGVNDEVDWFKFELTAGRKYVFRATKVGGDTDAEGTGGLLYAEGDYETPVAGDEDFEDGDDFYFTYRAESTGTYYLRVRQSDVLYEDEDETWWDVAWGDQAYEIEYWELEDERNLVFAPEEYWTLDDNAPTAEWTANPFLTTNELGTTPLTAITTADEGIVRWAFCEEWLEGIPEGRAVTNLVEVLNAEGARLMWGHAVWADTLELTLVDFTTYLPRLPAGLYRVRLTLNRDIRGGRAYPETNEGDNVAEVSFTVRDPVKVPTRLIIDGNAEIVGKATAVYRCLASRDDGVSDEVAATWEIVTGAGLVAGEASGGRYSLTGKGVAEPTNVVVRGIYGELSAEKTVTLVAEASERDPVFDPPVYHPDGHMDIAAGLLRIAGVAAEEGDVVAAYAALSDGSFEPRGHAYVARDGTFAMRIPLMAEGETIVFKAYDASAGDYGTVFDCLEAVPSAFDAALGATEEPFVVNAVRVDPFGTQKLGGNVASDVFATVTVGGLAAGDGDILAVFDGDTLVGKQLVTFADGGRGATALPNDDASRQSLESLSSTCSLKLYLAPGTHTLTFKIWDASAGRLRDCNESVELSPGGSAGSAVAPVAVTADVPVVEPEAEDPEKGAKPEVPVVEPGDPAKTHTVTFDLAGGADRVGGGELVQSVADGASAVVPKIACRAGYVFSFWNYPTNNVRSDRTITAAYRTGTRLAPVRVSYDWLDARLGAGSRTVADYEAAALRPTGKFGANGQPLYAWQEYLAGTDPADASDVFRADIAVVDGEVRVSWTPDLNTNGLSRLYTIWGKESLEDETWVTPTNAASRFFKVTVEEL